MRMAVTTQNESVCPFFDSADSVVVVDVKENKEVGRQCHVFTDKLLKDKAKDLKGLGVEVLICSSLPNDLANSMAGSGITIIPWVSGKVEKVVNDFLEGRLPDSSYYLP
jgi:predicted Fe-Mo cluster-binding NifX family protein